MWSEVEKKVNKQLLSTLTSLRAKISEVLTKMDREVVIHPYKMFLSRIEAIVEAGGDLIEQMCM
jgi:hypothetical protein